MSGQPWLAMVLVGSAYLAMFGVGELLLRRGVAPAESTRRVDHLVGGLIALSLPALFDSSWPVVALGAGFLVFLAGARVIGSLRSVHAIARPSVGAFLYPAAIALSFVAAAERPADYAVAVMALATADVAAGVVGGRFGRHRYRAWGQPKSWEGTAAAFCTTGLLSVVILTVSGADPGFAVAASVLVASVVAMVEGALPWGLDNLGIPLGALLCLAVTHSLLASAIVLLGAAALLGVAIALPGPAGSRRPEPAPDGALVDGAPADVR